ncbi:hypothetical protein DEA8626_03905 [Defluviimonas aquaemixtae]|uniref:Arylsulfotransferase (ASST) n=1 Tax=Albidovulum aquaemixtae TaxID=1542388 RepID=A0A2R8BN56_9RHOB|nr:arylsulfotransferase family protein [Defluviimonas aquaemixtae]SPH24871.1 hypothetical protein DEA8626_03905 [Defluviimonas aquaemixtae]
MNWIKRHGFSVVRRVAVLFLAFVTGLLLGVLLLPPAPQLQYVLDTIREIRIYATSFLRNTPKQHIRPRTHEGDGVVTAVPERMAPGVTFMSGLFGNTLGFRLYAADGELLYEWPINFFTIAPEEMKHKFHALIHGAHLYENGDIVANLDGRSLVRFDVCGRILWRSDRKSHHSIDIDDDGRIWTPTAGQEYVGVSSADTRFRFDGVAAFDPDTGAKLVDIDLVDSLLQSDMVGLVQTNYNRREDIMHLNDADVLDSELAPAFPMFEAGDIMLSSRNLFQLWVIDGDSHDLKWHFAGPLIGQHDADFRPDGTISVLDNRPKGDTLAFQGENGAHEGSRILSIDPADDSTHVLYQSDEHNWFYTPFRGKHQILRNGNILIVETDVGRVFEVTPDGEVVWSFINGWDDTRVGWVMGATRHPESYARIGETECD